MRIRFIHAMTGSGDAAARRAFFERERELLLGYAAPGTEIEVTGIETGAATIESRFDEYLGAVETLKLVKEAEDLGLDGVVITCAANACLEPARELVRIPVIGSGQAGMLYAAAVANRFSVITVGSGLGDWFQEEARRLGVGGKLASVRGVGKAVHELKHDPEDTVRAMIEAGRRAVEADGAQALVPGCFGMVGLAARVQAAVGVPCVELAGAAVKLIETLVTLNLAQSKLAYPTPVEKRRTAWDYQGPRVLITA